MKLLLTGASGFVGGQFLARFQGREGCEILGVGRRVLERGDYVSADLSQPFDFDFVPDVVIHAAARASPWGRRAEFERDNVVATRRVIDFCRARGLPRLVYVSSSSVFYRAGHQLGLTEASPIGPRFVNAYAATKAAGERLVAEYPGAWVIARPRAVFGVGDTVLFPRLLAAARAGKLARLRAPGGPAVGDLITIDTLLEYLWQLATRPELSGSYNLTNAEPVVIDRFLVDVLGRLGLPAPSREVPVRLALLAAGGAELVHRLLGRAGEPPITRFGVGVLAWSKTFDVARALRDLGPPVEPLARGVEAFVRWQEGLEGST